MSNVGFAIRERVPGALNRIVPRYFITPEPSDESTAISLLGTPIYSNLEFMKVSGTSLDNSLGVGEQNGNSEVLLRIDTVIMTVNQTKNIIVTPIQGRNGTVKEYISDGDFMITIDGAIVSEFPNLYPRQDVELFIELMGLKKPLPVASQFLDYFSIQNIVVERFEISEKIGSRNIVPFIINCMSDYPIEFKLNA